MSKKVMALEVENFNKKNPAGLFYQTIADCMCHEVLVLLSCKGLWFLVPHEVMKECDATMQQRKRNEEALNIMPPITITVQQCIPIPSETAKILLEL